MDQNLGYPKGIRFMPILDWKYSQIWDFIDNTKAIVNDLYK